MLSSTLISLSHVEISSTFVIFIMFSPKTILTQSQFRISLRDLFLSVLVSADLHSLKFQNFLFPPSERISQFYSIIFIRKVAAIVLDKSEKSSWKLSNMLPKVKVLIDSNEFGAF